MNKLVFIALISVFFYGAAAQVPVRSDSSQVKSTTLTQASSKNHQDQAGKKKHSSHARTNQNTARQTKSKPPDELRTCPCGSD
jgi:hypothetical protein